MSKQFQFSLTSALCKPRVRPRGVPPTHRLGLRETGPVGGDELSVRTAGVGDFGVVGLEAVPDVRPDRRLRRGVVAAGRFCTFYRFVILLYRVVVVQMQIIYSVCTLASGQMYVVVAISQKSISQGLKKLFPCILSQFYAIYAPLQ